MLYEVITRMGAGDTGAIDRKPDRISEGRARRQGAEALLIRPAEDLARVRRIPHRPRRAGKARTGRHPSRMQAPARTRRCDPPLPRGRHR